jgi:cell division protein ZapA (FtsZ GTPase activity inhibitor)
MQKLAESSTIKSESKLAVLTALNVADELYQLKLQYKKVIENFNKHSKELSERIDYYIDSYKQSNS